MPGNTLVSTYLTTVLTNVVILETGGMLLLLGHLFPHFLLSVVCNLAFLLRKLLIGGAKGHMATFDWQTGQLGCEFHVKETTRDIKWLHNRDYIAVAQKKVPITF